MTLLVKNIHSKRTTINIFIFFSQIKKEQIDVTTLKKKLIALE